MKNNQLCRQCRDGRDRKQVNSDADRRSASGWCALGTAIHKYRPRSLPSVNKIMLLSLMCCRASAQLECPGDAFVAANAERSQIGRAFYANDMCGVDAGSASVDGSVGVTQNSVGQIMSNSNVGALGGGGAGCNRRLEMLTWPAGTEVRFHLTV
eukprot:SAG11_NODE_3342_length_2512_cov_2.717364_3_plen_154_part_00